MSSKTNAKKLALAGALLLVGAGCSTESQTNVNVNAGSNANTGASGSNVNSGTGANVNAAANVNTGLVNAAVNAAANVNVSTGAKADYKDGTYNVTGVYKSPAGPESIKVSVTLKGDVIADVTVTPEATNQISVKMQAAFNSGYKTMVVGKDIDEVKLSGSISGSSLTPIGFNDAIAKVKAEAAI